MDQIEVDELVARALAEGSELGRGMKRIGYSVPGRDDLCVKCAYLHDGCKEGCNAWKNYAQRHSKLMSFNYREYRYLKHIKSLGVKELSSAFPSIYEVSLRDKEGWCSLVERIRNADGTNPLMFEGAYASANAQERRDLMDALMKLTALVIKHGVSVRDFEDVVVERVHGGSFVLRIVDFEQKGSILGMPRELLLPKWYIRIKVRSSFRRFAARFEKKFGDCFPCGKATHGHH